MSVRSKKKKTSLLNEPANSVEIQLPTKLEFHLLEILLSHEALFYKGYVSRCTMYFKPIRTTSNQRDINIPPRARLIQVTSRRNEPESR
jgi:hypothetical protein